MTKTRNPLVLVLGLSAVFFLFFLIVSGIFYLRSSKMMGGSGGRSAVSIFQGGSVGVLEISGIIMDSRKTLKRLEDFEEDPNIKAVVVRLDSPGGSVGPSQEIYEAVKKFKKPVVASMGSVAASGAFYVACGAKKVYANPGTLTGSIGVIMDFVNLEKLYEWAKVKRYALTTGKFKNAGADYKDMSPEERALLQSMLEDVLMQFKTAVAEGRKLPMEEVARVADGRIMSGAQAKAAKLVDELGTIQDAINEAGKMAKIEGKPNVVYPHDRRRWIEMLLELPEQGNEDASHRGQTGRGLIHQLARLFSQDLGIPSEALPAGIYWLWNGAR